MTEYHYKDIIEYIDGTYDENFTNAKKWAREHNTTFDERMDLRDLPKRYFQIGDDYNPPIPPPPPEPSEDEKKARVRAIRNGLLDGTDYTRLDDVPLTEEEKESYKEYRIFLRDFTNQPDWWDKEVPTYPEWKKDV